MARMSPAQAVLRGFRLSWRELGGRRRPRPAAPSQRLTPIRVWTVVTVPTRRGTELADTARRR